MMGLWILLLLLFFVGCCGFDNIIMNITSTRLDSTESIDHCPSNHAGPDAGAFEFRNSVSSTYTGHKQRQQQQQQKAAIKILSSHSSSCGYLFWVLERGLEGEEEQEEEGE